MRFNKKILTGISICSFLFLSAVQPTTNNSQQTRLDSDVVINEINYHSSLEFNSDDWIELYNKSDETIDISNWQFKDEDDTHIYIIPENTQLLANSYLVLFHDLELFTTAYPTLQNVVGPFDFGLSGGGEPIRLYNNDLVLVDSVNYDDEGEWPIEPDGSGSTLELNDSSSDNSLAENWHSSEGNGTPGEVNSIYVANSNDTIEPVSMNLTNYPNPFNPTTSIQFSLEKSSHIDLNIYNIKGQLVKNLLSENAFEGKNITHWNGLDNNNKNVSSGIYFVVLKSNDISTSKKIVLMK